MSVDMVNPSDYVHQLEAMCVLDCAYHVSCARCTEAHYAKWMPVHAGKQALTRDETIYRMETVNVVPTWMDSMPTGTLTLDQYFPKRLYGHWRTEIFQPTKSSIDEMSISMNVNDRI